MSTNVQTSLTRSHGGSRHVNGHIILLRSPELNDFPRFRFTSHFRRTHVPELKRWLRRCFLKPVQTICHFTPHWRSRPKSLSRNKYFGHSNSIPPFSVSLCVVSSAEFWSFLIARSTLSTAVMRAVTRASVCPSQRAGCARLQCRLRGSARLWRAVRDHAAPRCQSRH